jgi:hypothetical protein
MQAGITVGSKKHSVLIALDGSWSPGTYGRRVALHDGRNDRYEQLDGSFASGLTVAYYLPFFDLN